MFDLDFRSHWMNALWGPLHIKIKFLSSQFIDHLTSNMLFDLVRLFKLMWRKGFFAFYILNQCSGPSFIFLNFFIMCFPKWRYAIRFRCVFNCCDTFDIRNHKNFAICCQYFYAVFFIGCRITLNSRFSLSCNLWEQSLLNACIIKTLPFCGIICKIIGIHMYRYFPDSDT
jgi:hypothetical protein